MMIEEKVLVKDSKSSNKYAKKHIELFIAEEAINKIGNGLNKDQWNTLVDDCSWATAFQRWEFVKTWYELYSTLYTPILVLEEEGHQLTGCFPLAMDKNGKIMGAGADQAEYQVWVYRDTDSQNFVKTALDLIWKEVSPKEIHLKYLPQGTPFEAVTQDQGWMNRSHLKPHRHPILSVLSEKPSVELKKKNKREKMNRLKRQGELSFERVLSPNSFSEVLDELIIQSDFRKGAAYNRELFSEDDQKKAFIKALFDLNMLHVSLLKLDDEIIASNVGVAGKKWLHLQGINTHSPFQAKHSPGILHFLMLGQSLGEEGFEVFDLTPGADPYKSGLASDFHEAYELVISTPRAIRRKSWMNNLNTQLKAKLKNMGLSEVSQRKYKAQFNFTKNKWKHFFRSKPLAILKKVLADKSSTSKPPVLFQLDPSSKDWSTLSNGISINKNSLRDVLCYDPVGEPLPKQVFLMECMKKMEEGNDLFTCVQSGKLAFLIWLSHKPASIIAEGADAKLPNNSKVLFDEFNRSNNSSELKTFLTTALSMIFKKTPNEQLYIYSSNTKVQKSVEEFVLAPLASNKTSSGK
ncbi:hypothetical protein GCM10028791_37630 [Echinicola sediminis]